MRYLALACDYDGTLAHDGVMAETTIDSLQRLRESGRRIILVTGRDLDDLIRVCPCPQLFDRIVVENGAVLHDPATHTTRALAEPPPAAFVEALREHGVTPLSVGRVIVATWEPYGTTVLQTIQQLGLELQVIFNKGAVMVLPPSLNKAAGLQQALMELKLSPRNTVGIGDAENDHAFLAACECGVAVANALESVKARADLVTGADHGDGVVELIERLLDDDLRSVPLRAPRGQLVIGQQVENGEPLALRVYNGALLMAGPSGGGKTTITTTLLEQLVSQGYQCCVIDPEGDYHEFPDAIALRGDPRALAEEALRVLDRPAEHAIVSLLDVPLDDRPSFFQTLFPRLLELRAATGRPHALVIDEAHHLLPSSWQPAEGLLPPRLDNIFFVTVHPDHVSRAALKAVEETIIVGRDPQSTMDSFARGRGTSPVRLPGTGEHADAPLAWHVRGDVARAFRPAEPEGDRRRHQRKYAEGELGEDKSFYFRGPHDRLNLRAQNLGLFLQIASGVDDETWDYHVGRGDISRWFRDSIKDDGLADETATIESSSLPADESRARIREAVEQRYTGSA